MEYKMNIDTFTVRELRSRTGELLKDAENGKLALVTKHGRPAFLAVPFSEQLINNGVNRSMALSLFQEGLVSMGQAAKISGTSQENFIELLKETDIPAVAYSVEELEDELSTIT